MERYREDSHGRLFQSFALKRASVTDGNKHPVLHQGFLDPLFLCRFGENVTK